MAAPKRVPPRAPAATQVKKIRVRTHERTLRPRPEPVKKFSLAELFRGKGGR